MASIQKSAFESLPREIRDQIYEYVLLFNGEIIPFPQAIPKKLRSQSTWCPSPSAQLRLIRANHPGLEPISAWSAENHLCSQLLFVSRMIHDEAAGILYGRNIFHFTESFGHPDNIDKKQRGLFWSGNMSYFAHIVIDFHQILSMHEWSFLSLRCLDVYMDPVLNNVIPKTDEFSGYEEFRQTFARFLDEVVGTLSRLDLRTLKLDFTDLSFASTIAELSDVCGDLLARYGIWERKQPTSIPKIVGPDLKKGLRVVIQGLCGVGEREWVTDRHQVHPESTLHLMGISRRSATNE